MVGERESIRDMLKLGDRWPGSNLSTDDPFIEPPLGLLNDSNKWLAFFEEAMGVNVDDSGSGDDDDGEHDNDNDLLRRDFDAMRARSLYGPAEYGIPGPSSVQMKQSSFPR